jgi:hypothetical protein
MVSFHWRSKEKSTSSALKSRVGLKPFTPEWNLTPLRSLKVIVLPPSATCQLSASPGSTLVVPRSNSVSLS